MRDCDCVLVALAGAGAVEVLVGGHLLVLSFGWLLRVELFRVAKMCLPRPCFNVESAINSFCSRQSLQGSGGPSYTKLRE